MISNLSFFDSLTSSCVKFVRVANGALMSILGAGNVSLSPTFFVSSILFAPTLK
ncbi:hypothetical protein ACMBCN_01800, partial [Candidatus Liberibacter asiaticus]